VIHTYIKTAWQSLLRSLMRSVRRRAATSKRACIDWLRHLGAARRKVGNPQDAQEHWCSSGFASTDLKRHGIQRLIVAGLIAHTCVESTVRFAVELGYDVTLVKDATADYSEEFMHAAIVTNLPNYASAIVTTQEVRAALLGSRPVAQSSSAMGAAHG
jgi:Isochorismatase family